MAKTAKTAKGAQGIPDKLSPVQSYVVVIHTWLPGASSQMLAASFQQPSLIGCWQVIETLRRD
ncbi:hypothetical protein E4U58_002630 [Claviceps cyperi]|nr:hypothetical protein E4U58_002630 [Claviceps cyperi]